jgi:sugar phosphate isomerase/epimerase
MARLCIEDEEEYVRFQKCDWKFHYLIEGTAPIPNSMKLGISIACYKWELFPYAQRTNKEYIEAGLPVVYFSSVPSSLPLDEGGLEWCIDHCGELNVSCLYFFSEKLHDPTYREKIRDKASAVGLELIPNATLDWASTGDEAEGELERYVQKLRILKSMGVQIVNTTHRLPLTKNHYTKNPPISEQLCHMKENFMRLSRIAEGMGLVIALENHGDYRCSEIAQVLRTVNSPSLRAVFDTGNPVNVIEDPVEASKVVAPYVVVCHLKDYRVLNSIQLDGTPRFSHAPIGQGDIELSRILEILQSDAPDAERLCLCIESVPPLEVDPGLWVRRCIDNTREKFGKFLSRE